MYDFYAEMDKLSADQLSNEIEKLTKRLYATNPNTQIYNQLVGMIHIADELYGEKLMVERTKHLKDEIIEIGTIESTETIPDYSKEELVNIMVQEYKKESPR